MSHFSFFGFWLLFVNQSRVNLVFSKTKRKPLKLSITRRLSGIHAAWYFWFAVSFGGENGLQKLGLGGIHPLTQRYASGAIVGKIC
ncbi:hypothetical protein [Vibrio vulnificus]|uniref:hypothetical protein n=1 Tax=Vibrio vulnificus TaxID=672 RepID=UPI00405A22C4